MLSFALAQTAFHLDTTSDRVRAAAADLFGGYEGTTANPWQLFYEEAHPTDLRTGQRDLVVTRDGRWTRVGLDGAFAGKIDGKTQSATFRVGAMPESFFPGSLQNTLRVCLGLALAPRGGLLLHASAFARLGRAFAFFGVSGAGKSTLARSFPRGSLLSDEICCVTADGHAHRAPFTGETLPPAEPLSATLAGIFALQQSPDLSVSPLRHNAALRALLRCVVHIDHDRAHSALLLDNAARLLDRVPAFVLATPLGVPTEVLLATLPGR